LVSEVLPTHEFPTKTTVVSLICSFSLNNSSSSSLVIKNISNHKSTNNSNSSGSTKPRSVFVRHKIGLIPWYSNNNKYLSTIPGLNAGFVVEETIIP
jgi:hypothetical protein